MRRLGEVVAGCAALALLVSGCSTSGDSSGPELVIWTDGLKVDAVRAVATEFAAQQDIDVSVQVISTELQSNFVTANAAGNGPDVVVGAHDWLGNLIQNGSIDPLPISADVLKETYSPKATDAVTYGGRVYGVPYGVEAVVLYRNVAAAPTAPRTLDEAFAEGDAAVAAGQVESPFNLPVGQNGDAYHMQPIYTSAGGYLFGEDDVGDYDPEQLGVGTPESVAAAQTIAGLGEGGRGILRRSVSNDNSIALFTEGKAAFLVSGPWALADVRASGLEVDVQPVPGLADGGPAVPFMGAQAFMVASNGVNKAFAQEFVTKGVNNEQAMQTMYDLASIPPAMTSIAEAVGAGDAQIKVFTDAAEGGSPMPSIPAMNAVWEPLGKAYANIVGGADPDSTMVVTGETIVSAIES